MSLSELSVAKHSSQSRLGAPLPSASICSRAVQVQVLAQPLRRQGICWAAMLLAASRQAWQSPRGGVSSRPGLCFQVVEAVQSTCPHSQPWSMALPCRSGFACGRSTPRTSGRGGCPCREPRYAWLHRRKYAGRSCSHECGTEPLFLEKDHPDCQSCYPKLLLLKPDCVRRNEANLQRK